MQPYLGLLGAAGAFVVLFAACGGKVVVESSGASGTGGAGGTGSTFTTADGAPNPTNVTVGVSTVAATSVTTGTGASCEPTYTCAEAITPPEGDPGKLCEGVSAQLYDALAQCVCVDACAIECGANTCAGQATSASCNACLTDPVNGCGNEFNACANDL